MSHTFASRSRLVTFTCNSDLSGDVTIAIYAEDGRRLQQLIVPADAMKEFMAERVRAAKVKAIQEMTEDEVLQHL